MTLAEGQLSQLASPLASALRALAADPAVNGDLTIVSGWRSNASQIALRRQNCGTTDYDVYQKPSSQCSVPTAIPGTSNHEATLNGQPYGLAADLGGNLTAAHAVMGKYGLHTPVAGEPWHFELTDTPTLRKMADAGQTATLATSADPVPTLASTPAPTAPDWGIRIAEFAGGAVLAGLGLYVLVKTGGRPRSRRGKPRADNLDGAGHHRAITDQTDDGGSTDDTPAGDPSDIAANPGDEGVVADAGTENAGAITQGMAAG